MSDHTKAPGFPLLMKMIKSRRIEIVKAHWVSADSCDQINLRSCIATFRDEKKALDKKKREFDTVEIIINNIEKTINSVEVGGSRHSSGEDAHNELMMEKPAKKAKTEEKPISNSGVSGSILGSIFGSSSSSSSDV
jgi:hypothetical protein